MEHKKESSNYDELSIKVLEMARQELFMSMRYLFEPLNMLEFKKNSQIKYMATEGKTLYYNPIFIIEAYKNNPVDVNRAFFHVVLHCLFRQIYAVKDKKPEVWDLACDVCIEYLIDGMELSSVQKIENTKREMFYKKVSHDCRVMSAQNIYYYLLELPKSELERMAAEEVYKVDDHQYWYHDDKDDKKNDEKNRNDDDDNKDRDKWQKAAQKMQSALNFDSGRGDSKGNLKRLLMAQNHKNMSYRDFLRKFMVVNENMHVDLDSFDYGYYNYGLSVFGNMPLIEELEYREESGIEELVIVIDTSGSCAGELIREFINATFDIFEEKNTFFEKINVHIIQCDNQIQKDQIIKSVKDIDEFKEKFEASGYGGTDFRPAFNYINGLKQKGMLKRLRGVIYFTDGYGIYPAVRPSYDTAFVFPGEYDADRKVPPWAMRIDLPRDEIKTEKRSSKL